LALLVGCRDVLGIEELSARGPDTGLVDAGAVDARACSQNTASGVCHSCLATSCCKEIEACNDDETCRRTLECNLKCAPGDESCAAKCTIKFGPRLADVLSCRARSCADPCATSCGGTLGAVFKRRLTSNTRCAQCLAANACVENTACAADTKCLQSLACSETCSLLDRSCNAQCRFPLGPQPGVEKFQAARVTCRTECGEGTDWSCVGTSKYAVGSVTGEVELNLTVTNALDPTQKMSGVTLEPCLDPECKERAGKPCLSDKNGFCSGTILITAPGPIFRGIVRATGGGIYPTLYFIHPALTGGWPGSPAFTPNTAAIASESGAAVAFALAGIDPIPGRGHITVVVSDCTWSSAEQLTLSITPTDDKVAIRYVASGRPSADAKSMDATGVGYVLNVEPSSTPYLLTAKYGEKVVAEERVFVRANMLTFGLLGPK
jgi:hypothetical protein